MKKLKSNLKKTLELTIFISVLTALVIFGLYKPTIIGFVTYEITEHEKTWDFTESSEYTYNDSLIQVNGDVQLVLQEEILGKIFQNEYNNYYGTEDTRIYEKYPSYSYSSNPDSPIKTLEEESQRMLIRFNDFIGEDKIPNDVTINSAILKIYSYSNDDNGLVSIYELKKNWTEGNAYKAINQEGEYGCTWNKAMDYYNEGDVNWSTPGADGESDRSLTALDTKEIPEGNNWIYFDITDVVQKWVNNQANYGVIFIADDDEGADNFFGKENGNNQYHPVLIINYTHLYYPDSAVIDTQDFTVSDLGKWDLLTKDETLNEQEINYYYSIDSGENWNLIENFNLSYVNNSTIKLRAELISDSIETPILNSLSLKYITSVVCNEDWHCADWQPEVCPRNETQTRICLDLNECESEDDKPDTIRSCEFNCVENWIMYTSECREDDTKLVYYNDEEDCGTTNNLPANNGSILECDYCLPNFICVTYDSCNVNIKTKECNEIVDTNYCYELTGLESDNIVPNLDIGCTEFTLNTTIENEIFDYNFYYNTNETLNIDLNKSELFIDMEISNVVNGSVSIANYDDNLVDETVNTGLKYFEINASDNVKNNLDSNKIKIYYTDEEINNKNLDEDTLKIYYYNNGWIELNSTLNKTGKYLEVILDHLSYYGIFGKEKETTTSGGGGGSSGGYILTPEQKEMFVETETKSYEIESSIENEIDFVDSNKYRFNIKNKGNKIDKVELSVNNPFVRLSGYIIEDFDKDAIEDLLLITDPILTRNKPNLLIQGSSVKTIEQQIKDVLMEFTILGTVEKDVVINRTIPLSVKLISYDKIKNTKVLPYNIGFIIFMIAFKVSLLVIWKVFKKKKKNIKIRERVKNKKI